MDKKNFKIPVALAVFVALVTVLGACAPGITPGVAPEEIPIGLQVVEEAPVLTPEVGLSEEPEAVAEATNFEDFLSRLDSITIPNIEEEFSGLVAPLEGQIEEHMVTEFPGATIVSLDEELVGLAAPVEMQIEEHMLTEFPAGSGSLDDEFISAFGLAPVEQLEEDIVLEFTPEEGLVEDNVVSGITIVDELTGDYVISEFATAEDQIDPYMEEAAPIIPAIQLGSADLMDDYWY